MLIIRRKKPVPVKERGGFHFHLRMDKQAGSELFYPYTSAISRQTVSHVYSRPINSVYWFLTMLRWFFNPNAGDNHPR